MESSYATSGSEGKKRKKRKEKKGNERGERKDLESISCQTNIVVPTTTRKGSTICFAPDRSRFRFTSVNQRVTRVPSAWYTCHRH